MLTPVAPEALSEEMIPQAIIGQPTSYFEHERNVRFKTARDELDEHLVAVFRIDAQGLVFALMHYPGYPDDTTTVYLPARIRTVDTITYLIGVIANELKIPRDWITWERAKNPDL